MKGSGGHLPPVTSLVPPTLMVDLHVGEAVGSSMHGVLDSLTSCVISNVQVVNVTAVFVAVAMVMAKHLHKHERDASHGDARPVFLCSTTYNDQLTMCVSEFFSTQQILSSTAGDTLIV